MMPEFSMYMLDIVQNSIKADANTIIIKMNENTNLLSMTVIDNGCGMTEETIKNALNMPVDDRNSKLGIPMLKQLCDKYHGNLIVKSKPMKGTFIKATVKNRHANQFCMGDLPNTVYILIAANINIDFLFIYKCNGKKFVFNTRKMKAILANIPITHPLVMQWIKKNIIFGISST